MAIDPDRLLPLNDQPLRPEGDWVLYWCVAARRRRWNPALEHAAALARQLGRPLLVLEALDVQAPWATLRSHHFAAEGMLENAAAFEAGGAMAWPYLEPSPGAGRGLVEALAARAAALVTDVFPAMHLPKIQRALAARVGVRVEAVDGWGLLPLRAGGVFGSAFLFRRHLQGALLPHLHRLPAEDPLRESLPAPVPIPAELAARWPRLGDLDAVRALPVDTSAGPIRPKGGEETARRVLTRFVEARIDRYGTDRSHPDLDVASGLSPWLHFGHTSIFEVLSAVTGREGWAPERIRPKVTGKREGWWGLAPDAEAFLDEAVTWRELGAQYCFHRPDFDRYDTLPGWARASLDKHRADPRPHVYRREQLREARTHDPIWNAAQRELRQTGVIQNYLRMLWAKKVLEWSPTPEEAWDTLIELNNRDAIDGRDPNSYTGIAWCFGRFDRPWGPERPIFGTIRYMSSDNTRRKLDLTAYLHHFGDTSTSLHG